MNETQCYFCGADAQFVERPVLHAGKPLNACVTCWARIGRAAVRFNAVHPGIAYWNLDDPLTPEQIKRGQEIADRYGLRTQDAAQETA